MTDTIPPPDWDIELRALRAAATSAGIRGALDPADAGVRLDTADELLARLLATDPVDELAQRRRRTRRRVLLASGVAAAGLVVTSILQPWGGTPVQAATPAILDYEFAAADTIAVAPGQDPSAALERLSAAAAGAPAATGSGVQHVVTDSWVAEFDTSADDATSALIPQITESWLAPDGSLRTVTRRDDALAPDGRGLPRDGAWNDQPTSADESEPPGTIDAELAATLPTDATGLRRELLEISGCRTTDRSSATSLCLYDQVVALNQTYVIPAALDRAIWEMLGGEAGFRTLGSVEDRVGRDGVGISLISSDRPEYRLVLIADPSTGDLLGSEQILIRSVPGLTIDAPAITSFSAILESEHVT
ncbi:CU044_5270 family protein [Aeromicrobium stalagmiti]|uniref:CU044_5270 family protein n=1 Tax=Aeromicrobium stalagmiti TaxID=2738988 RepID=UPI001568583B|nr:CU044_5270 family protein [Aeromicrobium stalagmiti]NRQ48524.1 CU044_5270 family protein [Aeromicrobium stalagmiti]